MASHVLCTAYGVLCMQACICCYRCNSSTRIIRRTQAGLAQATRRFVQTVHSLRFTCCRGHSSFRPLACLFVFFSLLRWIEWYHWALCTPYSVGYSKKISPWSTAVGEVRVNILPLWWRGTADRYLGSLPSLIQLLGVRGQLIHTQLVDELRDISFRTPDS